ncbi:MAG: triphosphoribosyl-dephospho-CoA synthase [Desulfurococcales archaeon]|nr:triphosphoribosyl-dephospho-CoA synthase [Desulfurococcales archaeon]
MIANILRSIMEGAHLAIYSSIKPGGVHRLRIDATAYNMMSSCISVMEYIVKAMDIGEKVRRGDLAANSIGLGRLLARAIREAYRWNRNTYVDIIVPSITNALILSYVEPDSVIRRAGELRRALDIMIGGTRWRDIREFMDALRSIGDSEKIEHLRDTGISYSQAMAQGLSLSDAFNTLASKWPGFLVSTPRDQSSLDYVKTIMEYYRRYRDANNAIIALYLDMISPRLPNWAKDMAGKAIEEGLMATKTGSKTLFNMDLRLRKEGYIFDEYIPLLTGVAQLAVYEGLRP